MRVSVLFALVAAAVASPVAKRQASFSYSAPSSVPSAFPSSIKPAPTVSLPVLSLPTALPTLLPTGILPDPFSILTELPLPTGLPIPLPTNLFNFNFPKEKRQASGSFSVLPSLTTPAPIAFPTLPLDPLAIISELLEPLENILPTGFPLKE